MSLFSPKSTILQLIKEAEDFTVTPDMEMQNSGSGSDIGDVTTELSAQAPAPAPVAPGGTPQLQTANIPQPQSNAPTTVSKTVINSEVLLAQLAELKSVIATYEKKFENDDIAVENSKVAIGSLLNVLIYHAEKLQSFLGLNGGDSSELPAAPEATPASSSEPVMPPMNPAPTASEDTV
jgi:hypothetical protein